MGAPGIIASSTSIDPGQDLVVDLDQLEGLGGDLPRSRRRRRSGAEACKLIEVDYEVLPWSIEIDDAIKPDAAILHEFNKFDGKPSNIAGRLEHKKGDIAEGFKKADIVIERTFTTRPVHQGYIEPHACLISVAPDGKTTIWSSSQGQFMVRAMTAHLTGIPQSDIRAIPAEIGGGFGGKTIVYLEPLATLLSKKSGRPVKMVMTREEVMRATGPTSGSKSTVKIGATKDGKIVAAHGTFYLQAGALPGSPIRGAAGCSFAPYDIPNLLSEGFDVVPTAPRSRPIARRARRSAPMRSNACSTKSPKPEDGPARLPPEERREGRHQGRARPGVPAHRLYRDAGSRKELGSLQGAARQAAGAGASPPASGSTPAANPPRRSTSPRTATSSSPRAIPTSAARARASPTSAPSCSASTTAASPSSSATRRRSVSPISPAAAACCSPPRLS